MSPREHALTDEVAPESTVRFRFLGTIDGPEGGEFVNAHIGTVTVGGEYEVPQHLVFLFSSHPEWRRVKSSTAGVDAGKEA